MEPEEDQSRESYFAKEEPEGPRKRAPGFEREEEREERDLYDAKEDAHGVLERGDAVFAEGDYVAGTEGNKLKGMGSPFLPETRDEEADDAEEYDEHDDEEIPVFRNPRSHFKGIPFRENGPAQGQVASYQLPVTS